VKKTSDLLFTLRERSSLCVRALSSINLVHDLLLSKITHDLNTFALNTPQYATDTWAATNSNPAANMSTTTNPTTAVTVSPTQPVTDHASPPTRLVRIIHYPVPDLTYEVQICDPSGPLYDHQGHPQGYATHNLAKEPTLFSFSTSTFSFANFGLFSDFLSSFTPANVASMATVQWEAQDSWDVAGGSTLTVARMLVDRLLGLQEVVILLVMPKKNRDTGIVKRNLCEWENGLAAMKEGLSVVVRRIDPGRFKTRTEGGIFWRVNPTGGKPPARKATGQWCMDERAAYTGEL
jgi:hypothetical protein